MNWFNIRQVALCSALIFSVTAMGSALTLMTDESEIVPVSAPVSTVAAELVSMEYVETPEAVPANVRLDRLSINTSLVRPLEQATVTSGFGFRTNPVTGEYTFHTGVDLAAPEGSGIYSVMDGVVSLAQYDSGYGNYIIVDHASGLQTLYAHCSELLFAAGDAVSAGERIALVGSTGRATGAHLHFEVRLGGLRYNPECVVGEMYL